MSQTEIISILKSILVNNETIGTQEALCDALRDNGLTVTQSSLSRLLRKIGVVKITNPQGQLIYSLPQTPQEPSMTAHVSTLITDIDNNETMIVIHTNPGCASLIASILDHRRPGNIIGTIAGDDTVMVLPGSTEQIDATVEAIRGLLFA